jgi:glyoxylase-like metal-dependent hydrolase (beta-lactamase superfamily II)
MFFARAAFAVATALLAASGLSRASDPYANSFDVRKIADGVYAVIRNYPTGLMVDGNSVFIVNDDDVVVVDAPEASKDMIAAIRKVTAKPVRYVINTHWHDDHITGNHDYREAFPGVSFIGHRSLRDYLPGKGLASRKEMIEGAPKFAAQERDFLAKNKSFAGGELTEEERAGYASDARLVDRYMAEVPNAPIILPDIAVEDRLTLYRGNRTIEILHLPGHTAGDLVVHLPAERVAITGDLVVWPIPLIGDPQSHIADWAESLKALRALHASAYVPGHGPVLRGDSYLALMEGLMTFVRTGVAGAVARGETLEQARKDIDLRDLRRRFAGDSKWLGFIFDNYVTGPAIDAAFHEMSAATGADAPRKP